MSHFDQLPTDQRYYLLRVANEQFHLQPDRLNATQLEQARQIITRQQQIEDVVLGAPEAIGVVVPQGQIDEAFKRIAERYENDEQMDEALASHGLSRELVRPLLARELKVEAVMERVCAGLPAISDTDAGLYYFNHLEKFDQPLTIEARHILITINPDFPENTPEMARSRLQQIAKRLRNKPDRFGEQALKHSECPTSLNGGKLGMVQKGLLYPELDAVLFEMRAGQLSDVIESPVGLHLLFCEAVHPARRVPLEEALPQLREKLTNRKRKAHQRQWLAALLSQPAKMESQAHG